MKSPILPGWLTVLVLASLTFARALAHHLAITEVMSEASSNLDDTPVLPGPDWWELTYYGSNTLNLNGYEFSDSRTNRRIQFVFSDLVLAPYETILFCRSNYFTVRTTNDFIQWWWGNCRPPPSPPPRIIMYIDPGFDRDGDQLWLYDAGGAVVDMVQFGPATNAPGHTFIRNPSTGIFDTRSSLDLPDSFKACTADDVGSPGSAPEALPPSFILHPSSQQACLHSQVTLSAKIIGLPTPSLTWFHENELLTNASPVLILDRIQENHVGDYWLVAQNASGTATSRVASLNISYDREPVSIPTPLHDLSVFPDQKAHWNVFVTGCPQPSLQWTLNHTNITGATNLSLVLPRLPLTPESPLEVAFVASNELGAVTNRAHLTVVPRPQLCFTELYFYPTNSLATGHQDWYELSNLSPFPVSLKNYRIFDDRVLALAVTLTNDITLMPHESIIIVEKMTPAAFRQWWGEDQLPRQLQIITYLGFGLSEFRAESIHLWNPGATEDNDLTALGIPSEPTPMVSLVQDNDWIPFTPSFLNLDAYRGENGTIRASDGALGSPGLFAPVLLSLRDEADQAELTLWISEDTNYQLLYRDDLRDSWTWDGILRSGSLSPRQTIVIPKPSHVQHRFYSVLQLP